jgi:hypothetical protein
VAIVSKTGWTSVGELAMTFRISAVAVCRSSASFVSLKSRTFSIAITAWSAKVLTSSICLSLNGRTSVRRMLITPITLSSRINGTDRMVRKPLPACSGRAS